MAQPTLIPKSDDARFESLPLDTPATAAFSRSTSAPAPAGRSAAMTA
ncbi:hypothetical protein V6L77_01640 [Pannonibacter sp. Pt2-lr]